MNIEALDQKIEECRSRIVDLSERDEITPEEDAELEAHLSEHEALVGQRDAAVARQQRIDAAKSHVVERAAGYDAPQVMKRTDTSLNVSTDSWS